MVIPLKSKGGTGKSNNSSLPFAVVNTPGHLQEDPSQTQTSGQEFSKQEGALHPKEQVHIQSDEAELTRDLFLPSILIPPLE